MGKEYFERKIWVANGNLSHYYVIKGVCDGRRHGSSGKYRVNALYHNVWRDARSGFLNADMLNVLM